MKKFSVVCVVTSSLLLTSCANNQNAGNGPSNKDIGTTVGVIGGALAGSFLGKGAGKAVAILAGAAIGGVIGNRIGAALDEREQKALAQATQNAAENGKVGEKMMWTVPPNAAVVPPPPPNGGYAPPAPPTPPTQTAQAPTNTASGWVIPKTATYQTADGKTCRDMQQVAVKGGQQVQDDVTVCRETASTGGSQWVIPKAS
jgi:surface antigen